MLVRRHLTPVREPSDPLGRAAAGWVGTLSERAGEPVPYAFALALARHHGAPPVARSRAAVAGSSAPA